jgi:hypothetical protein
MSYIGNQPQYTSFLTDTFSGNGVTTAFNMRVAPANSAAVIIGISGVLQSPNDYAVVGNVLTFDSPPPTGANNISVRYLSLPASNVVTSAYRSVTDITAAAGQTTFSTSSYTPGFVEVFRNGVRLGTSNFTATSGVTVVLGSPANAGDLVTVVSFFVSSVINAIPGTSGAVTANLLDASQQGGAGAMTVPTGSTGQRPISPANGMVRKNTTTGYIEYWDPVGALWRTADSAPELYSFSGTIQFSTCGQTGPYGPILSDATTSYTGQPFASTWLNNLDLFNVVAGVQFWRVPRNGTYTIRCAGARSGPCSFGGLGRDLTSTFSLTAGDWLRIIVGQRGEGNSGVYGGGGGASAVSVFRAGEHIPLIVSGGGAGTSNNSPASTNTNRNGWPLGNRPRETRGGFGSWYDTSYGSQIAHYWPGGGGGGWAEKGGDGGINIYHSNAPFGGLALTSASPLGGRRTHSQSDTWDGGFGGGGATGRDGGSAGGGGGWWGGNASYALLSQVSDDTTFLGGGSFSANPTTTDNGTNNGEGFVSITR